MALHSTTTGNVATAPREPLHVVRPGRDENSIVVRDTWRVGAPGQHYDVSETIHINSGNTHEQYTTPVVDVTCR